MLATLAVPFNNPAPPEMISSCRWRAVLAALSATALCACASVPPGADQPKAFSAAFPRPQDTRLGALFRTESQRHGGRSGFGLLAGGVDGFLLRLEMVAAAERSIDLQYFLLEGDATGRLLIDALLRAADRGVRVRLLIDDTNALGRDDLVRALDTHPHIEVRIFNPLYYRGSIELFRDLEFLFNRSRLDHRMHNKLFVVDNALALSGGRNVGDEYFQLGRRYQFGDYDLFAVGPVVPELSASFDLYWNSPLAVPVEALHGHTPEEALQHYRGVLGEQLQRTKAADVLERRFASDEPLQTLLSAPSLVWAQAQVLYDSPDKKDIRNSPGAGWLMQKDVERAAAETKSECLIITPFLIPGQDGMALLEHMRARGVSVGIVTNSLESTPEIVAHGGYMHYRVPLLEGGVSLHEVRAYPDVQGASNPLKAPRAGRFGLHGKAFVFDRRRVYIGSMNFDGRSLHLNTEIGLLIDSPSLARQVAAQYEALAAPENSYAVGLKREDGGAPRLRWVTTAHGQVKALDEEPAANVWQRLHAEALSLLPVDDEL